MSLPNQSVDFEALQRLDIEADALIQQGRWTQAEFARLWKEAFAASGGQKEALDFLAMPAEPGWFPDGEGRGLKRIPRAVTEIIQRLQRGWIPRVVLSRAQRVIWNGRSLASARAEVIEEQGCARIRAKCSQFEIGQLLEEMRNITPGSVVHNTMRTEHAGGWTLEMTSPTITKIEPGRASGSFETNPQPWEAYRTAEPTRIWIAPLDKPLGIRSGNLLQLHHIIADNQIIRSALRWSNWRLQGTYTYYFVKSTHADIERQYMIVETPPGQWIERQCFYQDRLALQSIFGEAIQMSVLYGLRDMEIIACKGVAIPSYWLGGDSRTPAIDNHLEDLERWAEPFYAKLCAALQTETNRGLIVPVEVYISSCQGTLDRQMIELLMALVGLSHHSMRERSEEGIGLYLRITRALDKLGISVPTPMLEAFALYIERLLSIGRLTEVVGRSDREYEREFEMLEFLRTMFVAMVARLVGYQGPIRGIQADEGSPSWWPIDPDEEKGIHSYVSVSAPAPITLPSIAEDHVLLLVEQDHHPVIIRELLEAAGLPSSRVQIIAGDGRDGLRELVRRARETSTRVVVLAGSGQRSVPSAIDELTHDFGIDAPLEILCAVPDVDAWLLADDELLRDHAKDDPDLLRKIDEMSLPEELTDPFALAHYILGPSETWSVLRQANIYRASVRSPSLRHFLSRIAELLGIPLDLPIESAVRTISRDAIAGLIREMMPADAVAWKTSDGDIYTAEKISREVEEGTEVGHQYARDIMRVAIDFLRRQARRRSA